MWAGVRAHRCPLRRSKRTVGGQLPEGMTTQHLVRALIVLLEAHDMPPPNRLSRL